MTIKTTAPTSLLDHALNAFDSAGFWIVIALIVAMILVQGGKAILKHIVPRKFLFWRKAATFIIAYLIGFQAGLYYLDGNDIHKWATFVGFVNPVIYMALKAIAVKRDWMVLQSIMKMRPIIKDDDGRMRFDETQTFMVRR